MPHGSMIKTEAMIHSSSEPPVLPLLNNSSVLRKNDIGRFDVTVYDGRSKALISSFRHSASLRLQASYRRKGDEAAGCDPANLLCGGIHAAGDAEGTAALPDGHALRKRSERRPADDLL